MNEEPDRRSGEILRKHSATKVCVERPMVDHPARCKPGVVHVCDEHEPWPRARRAGQLDQQVSGLITGESQSFSALNELVDGADDLVFQKRGGWEGAQ
jgi:hypothetical protein